MSDIKDNANLQGKDASKNVVKISMLEALGLTLSRESNRANQLGSVIEVYPVVNMFGRQTSAGDSLQILINGEVPYIDEDGNVGTSNTVSVSRSINMVAASCGAVADDVLPFTVTDFVMASKQVKNVEVEIVATLEERDGDKRIITNVSITGEKATSFGKKLSDIRATRLEEASKHSALYAAMNKSTSRLTV